MSASFRDKTLSQYIISSLFFAVGAFLAALALHVFFIPNDLIDGGVVGIAMILSRLTSNNYMPLFYILFNLPFLYLAYIHIRKTFVLQMLLALLLFAFFLFVLEKVPPFHGDPLEIIAVGGAILGVGVGLIIRYGGCLDGSEILGIIVNRRWGFTVGQVVLIFNFFVFAGYGLIFTDWHIAVRSLLAYIVAFKMMDTVIVGLDEIKSVTIISSKSKQLVALITQELGLGLTVTYGKGGYSGSDKEILHVIIERLDLSDLKELIQKTDPEAFISIENIHEVVYGKKALITKKKASAKKPA